MMLSKPLSLHTPPIIGARSRFISGFAIDETMNPENLTAMTQAPDA